MAQLSQTQAQNTQRPPFLLGAMAMGILAISSAAIFIRFAQQDGMPSLFIAGGRLLLAALLITPITLRRHWDEIRALSRRDWILALVSGLFLALHFALWTTSLEYTSVLISVTLVTTTPIWTALLELFVLRSRLRLMLLIGLVVTLVGGVMIGIPNEASAATPPAGNNLLLGASLSIAGAMAIAIYLIIGKSVRSRLVLLPYIWIVYGSAGLMLLPVVVVQGANAGGFSTTAWAALVAMALVPQLIGHSTLNYAVKYISATYVSIATKLEPIGSAILAYFLFTEIPSNWQIIGSVIILIGVTVASIERKPKPPTESP